MTDKSCERGFITSDEAKSCSSIHEVVTSKNASRVVKLLEVNVNNDNLQENEKCTISTIVNIVDKLNPSTNWIVTDDEKEYLLSFLDEASTKENLGKVLSRYLSTIKKEDNFLTKTFFDGEKNIDLNDFFPKIKDFIKEYNNNNEFKNIYHIIDNLYSYSLQVNEKWKQSYWFCIKDSNGLTKLNNDSFDTIYGVEHYRSLDYIQVKNDSSKWLLKYNKEKWELIPILDIEYDNIIIEDFWIFIVKKNWKEWLLLNNEETWKTEEIFEVKYDSFEFKDDGIYTSEWTIIVELDWKKWYFRVKDWKLITLRDFMTTFEGVLSFLWFKK